MYKTGTTYLNIQVQNIPMLDYFHLVKQNKMNSSVEICSKISKGYNSSEVIS